jgi:hypothetical protein
MSTHDVLEQPTQNATLTGGSTAMSFDRQRSGGTVVEIVTPHISGTPTPVTSIDNRHAMKTYALGRVCAVDGCSTVLSQYNATSVCALHGLYKV